MKILIYNYEEHLTLMDEDKAIEVVEFNMVLPATEKEVYDLGMKLDYEGYAYTILKDDGRLHASGIFTMDSLIDDLIDGPTHNIRFKGEMK